MAHGPCTSRVFSIYKQKTKYGMKKINNKQQTKKVETKINNLK